MNALKPLKIDIVSDVVCPWCYIGKKRIESALALVPDVPVEVTWRPFFLNPWVPREGISREDYLTTKFGSVDAYKGIAGRVVVAAGEEGLTYRPELVRRQPNTIDCHRLIHWADAQGKAAEMKQRLMELYFRDGGDLTEGDVLVQAASDVGLDADDVRRRLATDEDVALISGWAQEASDKGISGVPTFVFAQKYAISGAQAPELLARAIRQVSAEVNAQAAEMKQRLMELYVRDGGDLTEVDVLVQAASDVGLDADDVRRRLATDEDVALISGWAQEASDKGISGVPTFVLAQKYAISGAQAPELLARAIRQVSAEVNAQAAE